MSRVGRGARTLGLTGKGWGRPAMALLGRIAAGRGLEAVATDEGVFAGGRAAFGALRAALPLAGGGTEHGGGGIEDGDLLVVEEDESPPDGSIVVVLLREGEEVTVKRLFREGEMLRLRPEAPPGEYEELVVPAEEARVQGRVYVLHPPGRKSGGASGVSQLPSMTYGLFSYLVLGCVSAVVGYYFARKRTEYEVRYRHRVEVAEGVQGMVTPLVEEFEAALERTGAGPSGEVAPRRDRTLRGRPGKVPRAAGDVAGGPILRRPRRPYRELPRPREDAGSSSPAL